MVPFMPPMGPPVGIGVVVEGAVVGAAKIILVVYSKGFAQDTIIKW